MKRLIRSKFLNFTLILALLVMPISTTTLFAQDTATACLDAENQVASDINGNSWLAIGCLLGWVGWLVAYVSESNPPATQLLGKSPEYVAAFSDCYKRKAKEVKTSKALTGCLIGTAISVTLWVIIIANAEDATTDSGY